VIAERRRTDCAGGGEAVGDEDWGCREEPVIGEAESEAGGLRGFHGEPRLGLPLMRSLMDAGEPSRPGTDQKCA
jgi:hypothetical protein